MGYTKKGLEPREETKEPIDPGAPSEAGGQRDWERLGMKCPGWESSQPKRGQALTLLVTSAESAERHRCPSLKG